MTDIPTIASKLTTEERVSMPIGDRKDRFLMGPQFEDQAQRNHHQTLKRLAERGGLDWGEAAAIIEGRGWSSIQLHRYAEYERTVRATLTESPQP